MTVDDRCFTMHTVLVIDVNLSIVYFYPRLVPLHVEPPYTPIRCSLERLQDDGIYLLGTFLYRAFQCHSVQKPTDRKGGRILAQFVFLHKAVLIRVYCFIFQTSGW